MGEKEGDKKSQGEKKNDSITVVLKFDMHCEGCAKKIRKSIKKIDGVEEAKTDSSDNKLVVTGKVDPVKLKEIVEQKTKKNVELVSPQPKKAAKEGGGEKKSDDKNPAEKKSEGKSDDKKSEERKEKPKEKPKELPVATVLLKTRVHCDGCAQKIRKIVNKCEGVQDVNVDLQKDLITAKGSMNMKELLPYLNMKLKRTVELAPAKKDDGAGGDKKKQGSGGSEKHKEGGGGSDKPKEASSGRSEKPKGSGGDKKEGDRDQKSGGEANKESAASGGPAGSSSQDNTTRIEVNKMEYSPFSYDYSYAYDPRQQQGQGYGHQVLDYWHAPEYSHPPQMFSDENPNACSVM